MPKIAHSTAVDPILVSVLQRRLKSITEEMGLTLLRTTRSPILHEARDFVTGLYDAKGRMLEQTEYIPILAFGLQPVCEYLIDYYGDDLAPGDVILHNDVFTGGNQNTDVAVFKPIFFEGELVAWAACKGHQADIGGALAGGYNPNAREVWQEALRIPPVKIYEKGRLRKDVWNLIFANIRFAIVQEDIKAEVGACTVGERGVHAILDRYGRETFSTHMESLLDATEQMMRREIRAIPDGTYRGESIVFYDGVRKGSRYRIVVTVTVRGDEIWFDYEGTDPQTPGFVNAPYTSTLAQIFLPFFMLINADMPHNAGRTRPIHIAIPKGCFLNAEFPAATTFGNSLAGPHSEAIFRAFARAVPRRVTGAWNRLLALTTIGTDPRKSRPYVDILFLGLKGGGGATYRASGYDHIGAINCAGGLTAQDYEMFELQTPHTLVSHEYLRDSAGAGEWRGGLGVRTELIIGGGEKTLGVIMGDGDDAEGQAFGHFGGLSGSVNRIELQYPDGRVLIPENKAIIEEIPPGTRVTQEAGGGGGYGDPYRRPVEVVVDDVRNGILSVTAARERYGVVVNPKTLAPDADATARLRASRPLAPLPG